VDDRAAKYQAPHDFLSPRRLFDHTGDQTVMTSVLAVVATVYGVAAAFSVLLQARQMLARGGSCDVSARFLAAYVGGYVIWMLYGLGLGDVPIIVVDALGLVCGAITLAVALRLRGSMLSPASWTQCDSHGPQQATSRLAEYEQ
jgi:uncharacterized protein with PQ loop repeat